MNSAGIEQRSYRNELILVTTPEVYQAMTVDFLAGVFNITYANADTGLFLYRISSCIVILTAPICWHS